MNSEQEIKEVARFIILLTDSYTSKKERQQKEQQESVPSLTNIISSLQLLSKLIWNNNACKSVTKIPKLLQSLFALSLYNVCTRIDLDVDQQRVEVRHTSRLCLWNVYFYGDEQVQQELVNIEYGRVTSITFCTAGGIGEKQDLEIFNELYYIECFLRALHEGRNWQPSFQPLPLLARRTEEQIEEEGANEEIEAQIINKGYDGNIFYYANRAKAATLNCFIRRGWI
ncbi:MAG: hypothetical protein EZS28_027243 [Streblomastix strix]|uniref:Uncharacterized protein n=1 Tax=Streblomastix strix TaxID=222440 RepID=A0A5J4V4G3_9EUKA|nr:MAG: hypothetical protein EZS28_027243 [Streblomastix strix]